MRKERVTLKEIAEKLGISIPTVSRALKDYPDISKETKKAVLKLVEEMHYMPNSLALNLRKNKSNTIGVIIPEVVHLFFSNVINGIMSYAESKGYAVLLTQSREQIEQEKSLCKLLFSSHVDGVLAALSNETDTCDHFKLFPDYDIPVVLFDKVNDYFPSSQVVVDDRKGAYLATEHLIQQGCKHIVHLSGPMVPKNVLERYAGYREALETYHIPFDENRHKVCKQTTRLEGYEYIREMITSSYPFDGVFGGADIMTVGALEACLDHQLSIPEDVALVGYSDSEISLITRPQLSSVHQPGYEIGRLAAKQLIHEIEMVENNQKITFKKMELETSLKIRASSNRIRAMANKQSGVKSA